MEVLCGLWFSFVLAMTLFCNDLFRNYVKDDQMKFVNYSLVLVVLYRLLNLLQMTFEKWAHLIAIMQKCLCDLRPFSLLFFAMINVLVII